MTSRIAADVTQIVADVLGIAPSSLTLASSSDAFPAWDSVHHLNIMMALEERFGIAIEPEDIERMRTVGAIVAVVEKHGS